MNKECKYCIVPQSLASFWQLLEGLVFTQEEKNILQECKVQHVEISPKEKIWEIVLVTPTIIDEELIEKIVTFIRKKCHLVKVIFYQTVVDYQRAILLKRENLIKIVAGKSPIIKNLLERAAWTIKENVLHLEISGNLEGELLRVRQVSEHLQDAVWHLTGVKLAIKYSIKEQNTTQNEDTKEDVVYYLEDKHVKKSFTEPTYPKEGKKKYQRKSCVTAEGFIYGSDIKGKSMPMVECIGEIKNAVLVGTLEKVESRKLKESYLLFFELSDATDGIAGKIFFKKEEDFARVLNALSVGKLVRMKGAVRFDTWANDFLFMPTAIVEEKEVKREDHAREKRIELHAHTKMSDMDGLVSPKDLIKTAASWGWKAIAITDHGVVQAFPQAAQAAKEYGIKIIYGMEGYLVEQMEQKRANHVIILAQNKEGLLNLYKLVSLSHLRYFKRKPRIPKEILNHYRRGLIIGSACEAGELIRGIVAGKSDEELLEIAAFYDYLEVQPIRNNDFLIRSEEFPLVKTDDDLKNINLKVASLAKKLGKMLIATGDVHFLNPEDSIFRAIIMKGNGFLDADLQPPLYLKTTEEMLEDFSYMDEDEAYKAVVTNPQKINELIEDFTPIPDVLYSPRIKGADTLIAEMSYARAKKWYGENLPQVVQKRLDLELKPIIAHGFSALYIIAHRLVKKSLLDGYLVGSRGSVGSSFIATMLEITEVNPLPPHWRCPHCKYSHFIEDGSYGSGFDLPDKICPVCETPMLKDGHDIPFAVFLGFDGDKVPDIDLNFSGVYQPVAHKYTEELFGRDNVYRAGTIATVADKTAFGYVKKYFEEKGEKHRQPYINRMVRSCVGVKRTTGQHPAGIMVVPHDMDVHFFSPIQRPANKQDSDTITMHFDYHSISERLVKLDILGHDDPTVIKMLEDLTHLDAKTIPFDDKETLSLFSSTEVIGLDKEELGANSGTFGIPEFRTGFTRQMIDDTKPKCFSDLVRISGFSHGENVWLDNAQELIRAKTCSLKEAISARDDIMMYLIHKGIEPLIAFKTMEDVRKGKGIKQDIEEMLIKNGVPTWYIDSCKKIRYLFPRAHATAYVMMAYRIAYCKVHYPLAFYATYFSIRAEAFDIDVITKGQDSIKQKLVELEKIEHPDEKTKDTIIVLQMAWEMYLRGYFVRHIDLYRSSADKFILEDHSLLPPFSSIKGFGHVAATNLAEARKEGVFTSISDLKQRTGISKTCIEKLKEQGVLDDLQENDQLELFA